MITKQEERTVASKLLEITEQLNKIRWDLIVISLSMTPKFKKDKKK